jgi:putative inorganic carbon (HCO3(-)) transporter
VTGGWSRFAPAAHVIAFASVPFFPSFITLTSVEFPGISVVPVPAALVVLGLMLVLAVWAVVAVLLPPRVASPVLVPIAAFWGACLLAAVLGLNPRDGLLFIGILGLAAIWHMALVKYYAAPGVARAVWWSIAIAGAVACALAVAMVATRVPAAQYAIANGRAVGTFVLPGELAGYTILLVPVSYGLARSARSRALRIVASCACALGALAMGLSFSRTGWIGLAAALALFVALRASGARAKWIAGTAIVAVAFGLVLFFFNEHHNPSENYTRLSIWQAAVGVIERFPLTGVGPFGFSHVYPFVRLPGGDATAFHAHSMYLTFFAETGTIGIAALAWLLWAFGATMRRELRAAAGGGVLATAVTAGVAGMLVQGLIDTVSVVIFGLLLPAMALAIVTARSGTVDA